jgi:hypothetical protein
VGQAEHERPQVLAGVGEVVAAVVGPHHQPGGLHLAQAAGQQRPRQPGQAPAQVVEPPDADEHLPHDQQRPPLAEHSTARTMGQYCA